MAGLELTPQLFAIFASMIEDVCGVYYRASDRSLLETKLSIQAVEAGFASLLDYYYKLRYDDPDGADRRALVQAILVHETYLFRELPALEQLVNGYLTELIRERGRVRVWSAACSTGEEPTTLAMLLDRRGLLDRAEIVATDISAAALAKAAAGIFGRRALRDGHPRELAARYLDVTPRGIIASPAIRAAIRFEPANLTDPASVANLGIFDAIVCRNVLIYFRDEQIARVLDLLHDRLAARGVIVVGVSESLMRFGTGIVCEERGGSFFYRSKR